MAIIPQMPYKNGLGMALGGFGLILSGAGEVFKGRDPYK